MLAVARRNSRGSVNWQPSPGLGHTPLWAPYYRCTGALLNTNSSNNGNNNYSSSYKLRWWTHPQVQYGCYHPLRPEKRAGAFEGSSGQDHTLCGGLSSFLKIGVLPKEGLLALVGSIGKHTQWFQIIQKHSSTYLPPRVMNGIFLNDGRAGFCFFVFFDSFCFFWSFVYYPECFWMFLNDYVFFLFPVCCFLLLAILCVVVLLVLKLRYWGALHYPYPKP